MKHRTTNSSICSPTSTHPRLKQPRIDCEPSPEMAHTIHQHLHTFQATSHQATTLLPPSPTPTTTTTMQSRPSKWSAPLRGPKTSNVILLQPSSSLLLLFALSLIVIVATSLNLSQAPGSPVLFVAASGSSNNNNNNLIGQQQQQQSQSAAGALQPPPGPIGQQQQANSVIQMPSASLTSSSALALAQSMPGSAAGASPTSASTTSTSAASNFASPLAASTAKARYRTMYACEDTQLSMDCDFGSKINLIRANFGRFSITQCNEQGLLDLSTDCMSPISFRIMQDRCQDKQKCSVNATSLTFGDRCPKTRKYLEVHFQCQPDPRVQLAQGAGAGQLEATERVDLRNASQLLAQSGGQAVQVQPTISAGSSPILPPNNPSPASQYQHQHRQASANFVQDEGRPQYANLYGQPQPMAVMNSDIMHFTMADNYYANGFQEDQIVVTMRHTRIENMSNPHCYLWNQTAAQWSPLGSQILETNQTHTKCAFDQATSYLLVMDYSGPLSMISPATNSQQQQQQQQQTHQLAPESSLSSASFAPQATGQQQQQTQGLLGAPIPGLLEQQPSSLEAHLSAMSANRFHSVSSSSSSSAPQASAPTLQQAGSQHQLQRAAGAWPRFLAMFGYLLAIVFVAVALLALTFAVSVMRSSAGAALKSLGNFAPNFTGPKYGAHRRQDAASSALNKDVLVINNQNGHQFLYAPASATKISASSSTHILSGSSSTGRPSHGQQQHQLHQIQQRLYSDNGGTLSQLSAAGAHSNNYYYGLMGLPSLFQHQQQQQFGSGQQQQQASSAAPSYGHQANKSSLSNESSSANSSSGVESGSASMQQQQQAMQHQQQAACLVTLNTSTSNTDYNLMGHHHLANYGPQQQANPFASNLGQLTLNAHYSASGAMQHVRQLSGPMREHIYECVDDDKPYMARLLMPLANEQQFGTLGHHHQLQQQQQLASSRAMTLSTRLLQDALQQQQQQQQHQQAAGAANQFGGASQNKQRPFHQPAIVRDNQAAKTNIICSKLAQVTPQRATEISSGAKAFQQQQHDVMAIYNGQTESTTTTTAALSSANTNNTCYGRLDLSAAGQQPGGAGSSKLSTDC